MEKNKKTFKPLIHTAKPEKKKTNTLNEKTVVIKDTMNFERRSSTESLPHQTPPVIPLPTNKVQEVSKNPTPLVRPTLDISEEERQSQEALRNEKLQYRRSTMKTQKMSLDVMTKLEILDPFLRSAENITNDRKISINEKINFLIEAFLSTKLTTRQKEGFKAIYESYLNE